MPEVLGLRNVGVGDMKNEFMPRVIPFQVLADFIAGPIIPDGGTIRTGQDQTLLAGGGVELPAPSRNENQQRFARFHPC